LAYTASAGKLRNREKKKGEGQMIDSKDREEPEVSVKKDSIVVKCSRCDWMRLGDYPGPNAKEALMAWADQLHRKERPGCSYRFVKV
jgi:hypothetical protein